MVVCNWVIQYVLRYYLVCTLIGVFFLLVSVMETQTEKGSHQSIHVEFKEDTLSYMEKLLLKKHRRLAPDTSHFITKQTQIE